MTDQFDPLLGLGTLDLTKVGQKSPVVAEVGNQLQRLDQSDPKLLPIGTPSTAQDQAQDKKVLAWVRRGKCDSFSSGGGPPPGLCCKDEEVEMSLAEAQAGGYKIICEIP